MSTRISKPKKSGPEPRPRNRTALFGVGALVLGGVAVAIWTAGQALIPEPAATVETARPQPIETEPTPTQPPQSTATPETRTFSESLLTAGKEEPQEEPAPETETDDLSIPFELEQVANALSHVEVDENGDIVLNETAQTMLEQAFLDAQSDMDEQQLAELKTLIEAGLEGQAGAQAVQVAEKFYRYSNAFREVSDTLAMRADPQSLRNDYEQIARLRRTHLGPELAEQLYGREEQLTRYTLDVMAIQADPDLTPEQRTEKQQKLAAQYPEVMPNRDSEEEQSPEQATN